jgi:hypothetical protein
VTGALTRNRFRWAAALLALMALSAAAVLAWRAPAVRFRAQTAQQSDLTLRAGFTYDVELTIATPVWPAGTELEADRALYSYAGNPRIHIRPYVEVATPQPRSLQAVTTLTLEMQGQTLDGAPLWALPVQEPAALTLHLQTSGSALAEAHSPLPEAVIDLVPIRDRMLLIREQLGFMQSAHTIEATLVVRLTPAPPETGGSTPAAPATDEILLTASLPFRLEPQGFATAQPLAKLAASETRTHKISQQAPFPVSYTDRLLDQWPWLLAGFGALAAVALQGVLRRRDGAGDPTQRPEHRRFKAWITEGAVGQEGALRASVTSLEGLVDLAIDTGKRVIFDRRGNTYNVLDSDIVYTYTADTGEGSRSGALPLGQILLELGAIRKADLDDALAYQRTVKRPLGECLIALDLIDEVTLYANLARQARLPYLELDLDWVAIDPAWTEKLTLKRARLFGILPLGERPDGKVAVAVSNPFDQGVLQAAQTVLERQLVPVVARPSLVAAALTRIERGDPLRAPTAPSTESREGS